MFKSLISAITRALHRQPTIRVVKGDITRAPQEAIVNAANEKMLGGSGVDGAIHRAAGPMLLKSCKLAPELAPGVRCPTGHAVLTPGFNLYARYVIHTVGPIYESAEKSSPELKAAYMNALKLAAHHGIKSVAFPAISCGVYGYPLNEAAEIALQSAVMAPKSIRTVSFYLFNTDSFDAWLRAADRLNIKLMWP